MCIMITTGIFYIYLMLSCSFASWWPFHQSTKALQEGGPEVLQAGSGGFWLQTLQQDTLRRTGDRYSQCLLQLYAPGKEGFLYVWG